MSEPQSGPDEADLDRRLDEEREAGRIHRPPQTPATEPVGTSLDEERRATPDEG